MQRSGFLPLAIGLVILSAGLGFAQGALIAIAIPLMLYSVVRAIAAAGMTPPRIEVRRTIHRHRLVEGDELEVTLKITSLEDRRRCQLSVIDELPSGAELVDGENQFMGILYAGEQTSLAYRIALPRGWYEFPGAAITMWSWLGLTSTRESVNDPTDVIVHPATQRLPEIGIHPRRTRGFAGNVRANLGGQGMDFFGCRSYVPGDDVRRINWRAYAREDSLIINEYELERIADVSIVIDGRRPAHTQLDTETTFDHSLRAAGSLSQLFLERGNIVGMLVYGGYLHWVFPGTGRTQLQRMLDSLAKAEAAEKAVFENLRRLPTRLFPAQSQIILISPLLEEDDVEVVALLVDRGYSVILVCPHASTWETKQVEGTRTGRLATRITSIQRQLFLDSLIRTGTRIVNWDVSEPIAQAIERDIGNPYVRRHR